jgi:outer membrane protein assembly factor BamB
VGQLELRDGGQWSTLSPPEGRRWTHPVGVGEHLVVAEQCCGSYEGEYEEAVGRVLDPETGEVLSSFEYDDVVVDQDAVDGVLLVTYRDGRVVRLDPATGEQAELANGFTAASW